MSLPNYFNIAVASRVKRLIYLARHENDIMRPSGGIGRRVRFRCVCPRGRGGSSPLSGTQHNEGFCITINTEAFFVFEIYDINRIEALTLRSSASRFILYNIVVVGFVRTAFLSSAADLSSLKA